MADTEDPNIATLREALSSVVQARESGSRVASGELTIQAVTRAHAALDALASTLAERDRRIAEQQSLLRRFLALTFEGGAPDNLIEAARTALATSAYPAPAPGELAEALKCVRLNLNWSEAIDRVYRAAESWQRLQWRPASEAQNGLQLVTIADEERKPGEPLIYEIEEMTDRDREHGWMAEKCGWALDVSLLPAPPDHLPDDGSTDVELSPDSDALPALNGGDDNG